MNDMKTDYDLLCRMLQAFLDEEDWFLPVLSNASALLMEMLEQINWAGFYLVHDGNLVLGPFQGKPACVTIAPGKGVCGTALVSGQTQRVEDVHLFPGHIACDSASNSEIVIPLSDQDAVIGVLDIDSPLKGRFTPEDQAGLEKFAGLLQERVKWS